MMKSIVTFVEAQSNFRLNTYSISIGFGTSELIKCIYLK